MGEPGVIIKIMSYNRYHICVPTTDIVKVKNGLLHQHKQTHYLMENLIRKK